MANSYTSAFLTAHAAMNSASKAKIAPTAMLDAVYTDIRPVTANAYDTVNVNIASSAYSVTNVAALCTGLENLAFIPKPITLAFHPAIRFAIPDFDAARSDVEFRSLFIDEAVQKLLAYMDKSLADLCIAANFDAYTTITGGADTIEDVDMAEAWRNLATNDVPIHDFDNMHLITHPVVYSNLLQAATWTQNVTLDSGAQDVRRRAMIGQQWGGYVDYDRFMPIPSAGTYNALYFHYQALALVARALPTPQNSAVAATTLYYNTESGGSIPIRLTVGWDQTCLSTVVTLDALYGVGVLRKEYGSLITTT